MARRIRTSESAIAIISAMAGFATLRPKIFRNMLFGNTGKSKTAFLVVKKRGALLAWRVISNPRELYRLPIRCHHTTPAAEPAVGYGVHDI